MTIEYKDSKRIVKLAELSADTTGTQVTASNGVVSFDITTRVANHTVTYDMGSNISDSAWVMRSKVVFTTLTNGGGSTCFLQLGVGSASSSTELSNGGITQDFIGLQMRTVSSNHGWGLVGYNSTGTLDNPESPLMDTAHTTGTYYVEIKRLTSTSMSIGIYDSADYDTLISGIALETKTISNGVTGLRYIRVGNATVSSESSTGNVIEGTVTDVNIWNGVTTASGDSTHTIYDPKPTNVQDNSILVEKDTAKRYWLTGESAFTPEQLVYDSSTGIYTSGGGESDAGINIKAGSVFIGKTISQVSFYLKQEVNPVTENLVYCRLYRSGAYVHTFGTTDPDNITVGSFGWYSFGTSGDADAGNGSVTLEEGDRILLTWDRGGAYNDTALRVGHSTSDVHDGTATNFIKLQSGTWTEYDAKDACFKIVGTTPATWTYPPEGIDSSGQIAQLSGSDSSNSYTAASEFYTISTDVWDSAFNLSGGGRARAGSAGSTEHAYLLGGQDGSSYYSTIDKVAWADETNTTISRSARAWGGSVQNAVSVCVGQSYYNAGYHTTINEYTYGTMAETSQGNTSSAHPFGGSFGNSTYGFVINGQNTGIERYTYSDKSKTSSGFAASPTTTNSGGHTGNSTTGISINNTAGSGNARYDSYNISADTWTTGSATSSTPYENGRASGSSTWNLWSTQTNTSSARSCEKYNYSSGALSSFTSVATNLDGGDQDAGASSINTGVNS